MLIFHGVIATCGYRPSVLYCSIIRGRSFSWGSLNIQGLSKKKNCLALTWANSLAVSLITMIIFCLIFSCVTKTYLIAFSSSVSNISRFRGSFFKNKIIMLNTLYEFNCLPPSCTWQNLQNSSSGSWHLTCMCEGNNKTHTGSIPSPKVQTQVLRC